MDREALQRKIRVYYFRLYGKRYLTVRLSAYLISENTEHI